MHVSKGYAGIAIAVLTLAIGLFALAEPANAAKPDMNGPICTLNSTGTSCVAMLPTNGPVAALVHWEWTSCSSARETGNNAAPNRGDVVQFASPDAGQYVIQVFARNGNLLYSGAASTACS